MHGQQNIKSSRIPLKEGSALHKGRYLHNTQQTQEMNIHAIERPQTYALDRTATGIDP